MRLHHLGYENVGTHRLGDPPPRVGGTPVIVAWVHPPFDDDLDALERLRESGSRGGRPPLLLLAPSFPSALGAQWEDLFPAVFLPSTAGLPELGLEVDHLCRVLELRDERDDIRHSMEARVEARTAEMESAHRDVLHRLARASELRDDLTGRHAERVGHLAASLGSELGLPEEEVSIIRLAGPLHDLGKIAIPDAILNKPGGLTATEREMMERHTVIGARLLSGSRHPLLQEAERIARSHHEHWDGTGYPDGLTRDTIPISARLVAVADVFDSVTHTRPYREASSLERALSIIGEGKGSHFDPDLVDALRAIARRNELSVDPDEAMVAPLDVSPVSPLEIRVLLEESDLL
jgi:putative two-component system response regulator